MDRAPMNAAFNWIWHRKEGFIWLGALIFLGFSDPACHHYTLCPLDNLGFDYCPGCGLGRSIGFLFRLDIKSSFMAHPLGIPAICLLIYRMIRIFSKHNSYELSTI